MNSKLNISDIAELLAQRANISKKEAEAFTKEFFAIAEETLSKGEELKIAGLGEFKSVWVDTRSSINVQTGNPIEIAGHYKLTFNPDKELKEAVNAPFSCFESEELSDEGIAIDDEESLSLNDDEESLSLNEDEEELTGEDAAAPADAAIEHTEDKNTVVKSAKLAGDEILAGEVAELAGDETLAGEVAELAGNETLAGEVAELAGDETLAEEVAEEVVELAGEDTDLVEDETKEIYGLVKSENDIDLVARPEAKDAVQETSVAPIITESSVDQIKEKKSKGKHSKEKKMANPPQGEVKRKKRTWVYIVAAVIFLAFAAFPTIYFIRFAKLYNELEASFFMPSSSVQQTPIHVKVVESDAIQPAQADSTLMQPADTQTVVLKEEQGVKQRSEEQSVIAAQSLKTNTQSESLKVQSVKQVTDVSKTSTTVRLKKGETMTQLALKYYGNKVFWVYIYVENKKNIPNYMKIEPGTLIIIPSAEKYHIDAKNAESVRYAKKAAEEIKLILE